MYETRCKTTPNRNKKTLSSSFIPTLWAECMALNMKLCYQQTINNSDVWCFHKHFIFIFLCSCLCCLLRRRLRPQPTRLLFSRILFYFHYSISREIYWNWFCRNFCFCSGDCDGADGWQRTVGEKAELMLRISFDAIYISQSVFSNDSFFCCFIRKRGWERRRTQFMFLTVKEISLLPMHTPRSSFYILQYFPSQ